jgi:L-amino acid N-acyltransferase YncA
MTTKCHFRSASDPPTRNRASPPAAAPGKLNGMSDLTIRLATRADLPAINEIYNHYVLHSTCTYQEEPSTASEREVWFLVHGPNHPITVAEQSAEVVGWASLSPFHPRAAYRRTVENSVYVRHDRQKQGIGSALLADSIDRAKALDHHTIIALIDLEQAASVAIHIKYSFEQVGHLKEVGFKFNRWLDVVYLQKIL